MDQNESRRKMESIITLDYAARKYYHYCVKYEKHKMPFLLKKISKWEQETFRLFREEFDARWASSTPLAS